MRSAAELVVRLIEIPKAEDEITFLVTFKASARRDIEHSVRAVPIGGIVAPLENFQIIDVLGINLRSQIAGDVGVGDGDAVNQPLDLVTSIHMKEVGCPIGTRYLIRDHLQAIGAVSSRGLLVVLAVNQRRRL